MESSASVKMNKNSVFTEDIITIYCNDCSIEKIHSGCDVIKKSQIDMKLYIYNNIKRKIRLVSTVDNIDILYSNNILYNMFFSKYWTMSHGDFWDELQYSYKNSSLLEFFQILVEKYSWEFISVDKYLESNLGAGRFKNDIVSLHFFVMKLITINRAQSLVKKIRLDKILDFLKKPDVQKSVLLDNIEQDLFFTSGVSSTLPVFLEVDKHIKFKKHLSSNYKSIISAACRNSDIRVLKYIIDNLNTYHSSSNNNSSYISNLIQQVFSPHIPNKYSLRRLKIINSKIELSPYFSSMISNINSFDVFLTLGKFYGKNFNSELMGNALYNLIRIVIEPIEENTLLSFNLSNYHKERISSVLSFFESNFNKFKILTGIYSYSKSFFGFNILDYYENSSKYLESIRDISGDLISDIFHNHYKLANYMKAYNPKDIKIILSIYCPPLVKYCHPKNIKRLLFIMPFINYFTSSVHNDQNENYLLAIKLNYLKFRIKIWLRKKCRLLKLEVKFKEKKLGITNKVDKVYSSFSKIPPRHILPLEIESFTNTSEGLYLLREKADGSLVDFIPKDVQPSIPEYCNNIIKAEFIEDLDLYLIFDGKFSRDMTVIEKYNYLRNLHPTTKDSSLKTVSNFEELYKEIEDERKKFNEFLKLDYSNYRVYPKAAWLVENSSNKINSELVTEIIYERNSSYLTDGGSYKNDGLVLSPLNGTRELKVKPLSFHTIDVLNNGSFWQDREGNNLNKIICSSSSEFPKDTIWRCYPTFEKNDLGFYTFIAKDYRFDKARPNKSSVIDTIYNLHIMKWEEVKTPANGYYYHFPNKVFSENWRNLCKIQNEHLGYIIENLNASPSLRWLDLGCGSGKLVNYIKYFNPKKYLGVDFDLLRLLKGVRRIDSNSNFQNFCELAVVDLKTEWENCKSSWTTFNKASTEKFDYVVANFSLGHFNSDNFWCNLNNFTNPEAIFVFNIVNDNSFKKWSSSENYMYCSDEIVRYKFEPHEHEMCEDFIKKEKILALFNKYKWTVIDETTPKGDDLDSKYTWYTIKKII